MTLADNDEERRLLAGLGSSSLFLLSHLASDEATWARLAESVGTVAACP